MELLVDEGRIGGWVFVQANGTDTINYGPFSDYSELCMWLETIGDENGIDGVALALTSPESDPTRFSDPVYKVVKTDE